MTTGRESRPEDRETVFLPYGRSASGSRAKSSIGLGLTVSRRLAELMDGSLEYVVGEGATFRLTLPRPAERPLAPDAVPSSGD